MSVVSSPFFDRIRIAVGAADPKSTMISGQARFTVLTARLIRLEWSTSGQFEDRGTFAFPNRAADGVPTYTVEQNGEQCEIHTEALTLRYVADGTPFHAGNLWIDFDSAGRHVRWSPGKVNHGNLRGTRRTVDQCAGAASLQEGLVSREGWALFDDSGTPVWDADGVWVEARLEDHIQDWYFFAYGHDYKAALAEYVQFGGRIPLVPRYVLGGWWSRYWAYHADDLKQLARDFREREIPLDVLVIDMDWHTPDAWTGYTWNRQLFPDPAEFLAWVHEQGLYATLNLHPAQGVQTHEEVYPQFAQLLGAQNVETIPFRPADRRFMQHYFEALHHPLEAQGVDFWWLDWQQGEVSELKGLDPLPWLNHLHFRDLARRGTRPMLYSRWGGLGNHRYPIGFSGDAFATWDALRFQVYMTPTSANVVYGWWSHDIGGHFHATEPELYARWVQFGALSPCLRLHSTKDPLAERRPWAFPEPVYEAAKAAFQFRYRLLPYLYSEARNASERGLSLCTPMYYEYPEAEDAYLAREQYFLGDQMIAAPVVAHSDPATGLAPVDVWLPEGTWIEYTTLETYTGPRWVRLQVDLNRMPLFVKAGAIVPLAPRILRTSEYDGSRLELVVFPGADGAFDLYEDDGMTEAYTRGEYEVTPIRTTVADANTLAIHIGAAQGKCPALPQKRSIDLRVRGIGEPSEVTVNGEIFGDWSYEAPDLIVRLAETDRHAALAVTVRAEDVRTVVETEPKTAVVTQPFVHVYDYTTFEDAREQLGTLVIAPAADESRFDAEIEWEFRNQDGTTTQRVALRDCATRQIVTCPFADDGTLRTFRWRVVTTITWNGQSIRHEYESHDAYPSINRWRVLISEQPLDRTDVLADDGVTLPWTRAEQTLKEAPNILQPFALVLAEQKREQILAGAPLEACVTTTIVSEADEDAVLHVQCCGDVTGSLNGVTLAAAEPVAYDAPLPMLTTWMPPTHTYYALLLKAGANTLVLFTRPNAAIGWWAIGATVVTASGEVMPINGEITD